MYRNIKISFAILACLVASCFLTLIPEHALAGCTIPEPNFSSDIPFNPKKIVTNCSDQKKNERNIGNFAWQTFVALNWPAKYDEAQHEIQPLQVEFGNSDYNHEKRVWEYYESAEKIFSSDRNDNVRFTESGLELKFTSKNTNTECTEESTKPSCQPLVDIWRNYILSEVRMNPVGVEQIRAQHWDSVEGLNSFVEKHPNKPFELMCSKKVIYPNKDSPNTPCWANNKEGTIEIKAAWMVLPPEDKVSPPPEDKVPPPPDRSQYYTTTRRISDVKTPTGEETQPGKEGIPVALIGFHIVQKTSNFGWIWATFEHKGNAPDAKDNNRYERTDRSYHLFNPNCSECKARENQPPDRPYLWNEDLPHAVTQKIGEKPKPQKPSQITRLVPIDDVFKDLNKIWQEELPSFWKNYQLIGVQWLGYPDKPYKEHERIVHTERLVNVTLEPYVQTEVIGGQSCIACHTSAKLPPLDSSAVKPDSSAVKADFSYLMEYEPRKMKLLKVE